MKKMFFLILFMKVNVSLANSSFTSSIYKIDNPLHPDEEQLLLLSNGLVVKVSTQNKLKRLLKADPAVYFDFVIDNLRYLKFLKPLAENEKQKNYHLNSPNETITFKPTTLTSANEALRIFKSFKLNPSKDSQCYNRSHVWSYESLKNLDVYFMKAFLFFTRSYIRDFDYKWWFHNAPMTYLYQDGQKEEVILDPEFSKRPLRVKEWTDIFMKEDDFCKEALRYSDYNLNQENAYCYLIKESMYYYQPLDLERLDNEGGVKNGWIDWEIKNAFKQGFNLEL